jgi:hypothetical protein
MGRLEIATESNITKKPEYIIPFDAFENLLCGFSSGLHVALFQGVDDKGTSRSGASIAI